MTSKTIKILNLLGAILLVWPQEGFALSEEFEKELAVIYKQHAHLKGVKTYPLKRYNTARDHFIEGVQLLSEREEGKGLRYLEQAKDFPMTHFVLGRYYEEKRDVKRMGEAYKEYLAETKTMRRYGSTVKEYQLILEKFKKYGISLEAEVLWSKVGDSKNSHSLPWPGYNVL